MALTARQTKFYLDTFDLYRISGYEQNATTHSVKQPEYSASPTYSGQYCRLQTTTFRNSMLNPLGRSQLDNFMTEDVLHCDVALDIRDGDIVVFHRPGAPYDGKAYKVIGKGEARPGRANYNHVRVRFLDVKPTNVP